MLQTLVSNSMNRKAKDSIISCNFLFSRRYHKIWKHISTYAFTTSDMVYRQKIERIKCKNKLSIKVACKNEWKSFGSLSIIFLLKLVLWMNKRSVVRHFRNMWEYSVVFELSTQNVMWNVCHKMTLLVLKVRIYVVFYNHSTI